MKTCKRCSNEFEPVNSSQLYCKFCTYKHIKEVAAARKKHYRQRLTPEARHVFVSKEWEEAMERRANYIADYYVRTGVLLNF